jgi:microsomal dipeptidase-like Zn-dependent dipeptidase
MTGTGPVLIDGLQYCRWSRAIFEEMRAGGLTAVHATVAYHGSFREAIDAIADWNRRFRDHADLIQPLLEGRDLNEARRTGRTAIALGLQTPMPVEDDLRLVEILHRLGIRFMQLTYNNQSLLGAGWSEPQDGGVTLMGREVIREMNRLGMVIDLSHAGERTALDAVGLSSRPVVVSHANPIEARNTRRNLGREVMRAVAETGGLVGLSLYPHHLPDGSSTTLEGFGRMAAMAAEVTGIDHLAIGSDLCQDQPPAVLRWMRRGRWSFGEPGDDSLAFPEQPAWFRSNRDFAGLADALRGAGFRPDEIDRVLGGNWQRIMTDGFAAAPAGGAA